MQALHRASVHCSRHGRICSNCCYTLVQRPHQQLLGKRSVCGSHAGSATSTTLTTGDSSTAELQQQSRPLMASAGKRVRLAVVGDVHGQWSSADAAAVKALSPDAVLWVGDIGNEDVGLVRQIAALDGVQKAVILGNHDAWYTMTDRGRQRAQSLSPQRSSNSSKTNSSTASSDSSTAAGSAASVPLQGQPSTSMQPQDRVQQQLDVLGDAHVGYSHTTLEGTNICVVGARPFSKGGTSFSSIAAFMTRFGVGDMQQSASKVLEVIHQVPPDQALVIMAHNGPAGLGGEPHSICGVDWLKEAGDHGDPDLQLVLQQLQEAGRRVSLVLHGHMHHMIKGGGRRQMVHVDVDTGTVVLNAATVPRVVPLPHNHGPPAASRHHFLVVELEGGLPVAAADVWVQTTPQQDTAASDQQPAKPAAAGRGSNFLAATASAMHSVQHSKAKGKAQRQAAVKAAEGEGVRRLQVQAPQQLRLQPGQQVVDGFAVHVAEVYEVLRAVGCDGPDAGDTWAAPHAGDSMAAGTTCWHWFDAHEGRWHKVCAAVAADNTYKSAAAVAQAVGA